MKKIKVIIHDGIVTSVLSDGDAEVEVVSIDRDYEDYEVLRDYEKQICRDKSLHEIGYATASFVKVALSSAHGAER